MVRRRRPWFTFALLSLHPAVKGLVLHGLAGSTVAPRARVVLASADPEDPDAAAALAKRIDQLRRSEADVKCVTLRETLVPGQRLSITAPPPLVELFASRDERSVVLLGHQRGQPTRYGVEATLEGALEYRPVVPGIHPEGTADMLLVAGRLCEVLDMQEGGPPGVQRSARVRWTELDDATTEPEASTLARSAALADTVECWLGLVRQARRERTPTQLDDVLRELGPLPEATKPSTRALWVAGLINPLPALSVSSPGQFAALGASVAPEIRPSVLLATSAEARLSTVEMGLRESIQRLRKMIAQEQEGDQA